MCACELVEYIFVCVVLIVFVRMLTACSCNAAGSVAGGDCVREATEDRRLLGDCNCKANTQGSLCNQCRPGHFNLSADNELGCQREYLERFGMGGTCIK